MRGGKFFLFFFYVYAYPFHLQEHPDLPQSMYPEPEIAPSNPIYRIKDDVEYSVVIQEWKE